MKHLYLSLSPLLRLATFCSWIARTLLWNGIYSTVQIYHFMVYLLISSLSFNPRRVY